jgi:hypothetical protein
MAGAAAGTPRDARLRTDRLESGWRSPRARQRAAGIFDEKLVQKGEAR